MNRAEEIKAAIEQLSPEERCELAALLNPIEDDDWDRQMKKDAEPGGKLDRLMETAAKEYKEGKYHFIPLDDMYTLRHLIQVIHLLQNGLLVI